jgi:glycine/D-amino acid oxidase-like deaminating enzyme
MKGMYWSRGNFTNVSDIRIGFWIETATEFFNVGDVVKNAGAEKALVKTIETSIERGVEYRAAGVSKLLFDPNGACVGATLTDGSDIKADHILVAAGAGTPLLLYNTDPA